MLAHDGRDVRGSRGTAYWKARAADMLRKEARQGVFGQVRKHGSQAPAVGLGGTHCMDEGLDPVEIEGEPNLHEAAAETIAAAYLLKERLLPTHRFRKGALKVAGVAQAGKLKEFGRGGADMLHEGRDEDDPLLLLREVGQPLFSVGRLGPQYFLQLAERHLLDGEGQL